MTRLLLLLRASSAEAVSNIQTLAQDHYSGPGPTSAKEKTLALKKFQSNSFYQSKKLPELADILKQSILNYANNRPRSTQVSMGPSSAGDPCDRKLVAMLSGLESGGGDDNPTLSLIGVGWHALMADMLELENAAAREQGLPDIWLVEQALDFPYKAVPKGTTDFYHIPSKTCGDHKMVGKTTLDSVRLNGPGDLYLKQAMVYGWGLQNLGHPVEQIMIAFYPRNASPARPFMAEAEFFVAPYDNQMAVDTLERAELLRDKALKLDVKSNPRKLNLIATTPGKSCFFCSLKQSCPDAVKG